MKLTPHNNTSSQLFFEARLLRRAFVYLEGSGSRIQNRIFSPLWARFLDDRRHLPRPRSHATDVSSSLPSSPLFCFSRSKRNMLSWLDPTRRYLCPSCLAWANIEKLFWAPRSASFGRPCPCVSGFQNPQCASAGL